MPGGGADIQLDDDGALSDWESDSRQYYINERIRKSFVVEVEGRGRGRA